MSGGSLFDCLGTVPHAMLPPWPAWPAWVAPAPPKPPMGELVPPDPALPDTPLAGENPQAPTIKAVHTAPNRTMFAGRMGTSEKIS